MAKKSVSKYATLIAKLPKIDLGMLLPYQDKVERVKAAIKESVPELDATKMAKKYAELRKEKAALEAQVSSLNLELEALSQMLIDTQEQGADGWGAYGATDTTLRLVDGSCVQVLPEPYTVVENRDTFREWCIQQGLSRLMTLPWQTVNALTRERLLKGEAEPDGTKTYIKTKIKYVGVKVAGAPDDAPEEADFSIL